jgi:PDZ domain/Aspartyl protease
MFTARTTRSLIVPLVVASTTIVGVAWAQDRSISGLTPPIGQTTTSTSIKTIRGLTPPARQASSVTASPVVTAVVPFEMLPSNHMVVNVKFNDKDKVFRLIFDLGSPITLLTNNAAEESGAVAKDSHRSMIFGIREPTTVDKIELGELKGGKLPVMVMDHPTLKALSGFIGKPLDGILGYTFFARYKTTIDYQTKKMTFTPVKFEVGDLMKDMTARMQGPKVAKTIYLAPAGLLGLTVGSPAAGLDSAGVPVTTVAVGSPAATAGLEVGDVLISLDGRWTTTIADTYAAAAGALPRQQVSAVVLRDGKEVTLSITPKEGL